MSGRDDVESLLGAYSLDALSLEELRRVEVALAQDAGLAREADLHLAVAAALAEGLVDPADQAPASLWRRIDAATGPRPAVALGGRVSAWRRRLAAAVAVAALAALIGLAVLVGQQLGEIDRFHDSPLAVAAEDTRRQTGTRVVPLQGEVPAEVVLAADGTGYLLTPAAPPLSADETYQLWAIVDNRVISAGVLGSAPEVSAFHVSGEVAGFALTVEVAGGVVSSEREPVAVGLLTG